MVSKKLYIGQTKCILYANVGKNYNNGRKQISSMYCISIFKYLELLIIIIIIGSMRYEIIHNVSSMYCISINIVGYNIYYEWKHVIIIG